MNPIAPCNSVLLVLMIVIIEIHPTHAQRNPDSFDETQSQITTLARLVDQRLSHMRDVAAYKWINGLPIEDTDRERIVLESSQKSAEKYQLEATSTQRFFEQQIILAKRIQQDWFSQWRKHGFNDYHYADLDSEVRPALIYLGEEILVAIHKLEPWNIQRNRYGRFKRSFTNGLKVKEISAKDKTRLFKAVMDIKAHPGG